MRRKLRKHEERRHVHCSKDIYTQIRSPIFWAWINVLSSLRLLLWLLFVCVCACMRACELYEGRFFFVVCVCDGSISKSNLHLIHLFSNFPPTLPVCLSMYFSLSGWSLPRHGIDGAAWSHRWTSTKNEHPFNRQGKKSKERKKEQAAVSQWKHIRSGLNVLSCCWRIYFYYKFMLKKKK